MKKLLLTYMIMLSGVFFVVSEKLPAESCDVNGFIQKELTISAKTAKCVKAADLNGDGKLDIISASSGDNKLAWYEKTTNDRYIVRIIDAALTGTESFDVGDLDNDGDIDIVAAAYVGNFINWYENDGTGNFTLHSLITAYKLPRAVCVADIDSDGDMDIVSTSSSTSKTIDWFSNNGNKTFTKKSVATGVTTPWFVTTSDIDKDGDVDVLATSRDLDLVLLYKNNGSEVFTSQTIDSKADGAECVAVADINNDGNLDIVACSYWDNKIKWYKNDGSLNFTMNLISSTANGVRSIFLADVDLDNDMDVVYGSYWLDKVAWFENDGSGGFQTEHVVSYDNNGPQFVSCYDLNGDGKNEFLTASSDDNKVSWILNINNSETQTIDLTYPSIGSETVILKDIDNDGDNDVVVTAQMAEIVFWFENLGDNDFLPHDILKNTSGIRYAEIGDMNNDGYADIIIGEYYANKLSILYNDGAQNFSKTEIATLYGIQCIVISDINKDGKLDMVTASRNDDKICWFKQNNDGTFTEVVISNTADAASSVEVSDFDKDGDLDLLSTSVNDDMSCWYQNDGSGNFTKKKITDTNDYPVTISVGDINADGYKDCIIGSRNDNSLSYYKNDGSMNFTETIVDGTIGWISNAIVEDLNFDGYPDIVTTASKDNRVQWFKNNKSGGFTKMTPALNADARGAFFVDAGDMDSDGDLDLVSSSFSDDRVILYTFSTYKDNIISLIYPSNFNKDVDISGSMRWSSALNGTGYWVQTSLDSTFANIFSQDTIADTTIAINSLKLEVKKHYYWRVAATNGTCWTSWSKFRSFTPTSSFAKCEIILKSGWNMISSNVLPKNDSLKVILADVKSSTVIIKDATGKFYLPPQNSGTLKFWISSEGYRIYMSKVDTLQILGKLIDPTATPVKIKTGWNIIGYLRNTNLNAKDALNSILTDFVIVKNSAGKFFIPPSNNQLGDFIVGQGYQMYAKNAVDLYYPANGGGKKTIDEILIPQTTHYAVETETGNNASLILSVNLPNDIEIGIFNNNGKLIGSGVVIDNTVSIALIGDNDFTDLVDGAIEGENLTARAYNPNNAEEQTLNLSAISSIISSKEFDNLVYIPNEVYSAKASLNTEFLKVSELTVSPNPFESNTEISFVLDKEEFVTLSLYDVTGRLITRICNNVLASGIHKYQISSSIYSCGTYRLLFQSGEKTISKELVIVK